MSGAVAVEASDWRRDITSMPETTPIDAIQAAFQRRLSPAQKLAVIFELRWTAWELKAARIRCEVDSTAG